MNQSEMVLQILQQNSVPITKFFISDQTPLTAEQVAKALSKLREEHKAMPVGFNDKLKCLEWQIGHDTSFDIEKLTHIMNRLYEWAEVYPLLLGNARGVRYVIEDLKREQNSLQDKLF